MWPLLLVAILSYLPPSHPHTCIQPYYSWFHSSSFECTSLCSLPPVHCKAVLFHSICFTSHIGNALGVISSEAPITLCQPGLAGNKPINVKEDRVHPPIHTAVDALRADSKISSQQVEVPTTSLKILSLSELRSTVHLPVSVQKLSCWALYSGSAQHHTEYLFIGRNTAKKVATIN